MDSFPVKLCAAALLALQLASAGAADARRIVIASRGDVVSLDPYALDESLQLDVASNIYEPLVARGADRRLTGALALRWEPAGPRTWRFHLRRNVRFHDGSPFTADDVVFSLERSRSPGTDIANIVAPIRAVRAAGPYTVDIELHAPSPAFPESLPYWLIMSRAWSMKHGAATVREGRYAALHANGTGPFRLVHRTPGEHTDFERNPAYWDKTAGNVTQVRFRPIADDAARAQALLDGEADIAYPLPQAAQAQVKARPDLQVLQGPELRVMFLGMDQSSARLRREDGDGNGNGDGDGDGGPNPLADRRVRQALAHGLDIPALVAGAMEGAATPAGLLVPPEVNGHAPELDHPAPHDPALARALLAQAGYPDGFAIRLSCSNNRYVNDGAVCAAIAAQLGRIGVRATAAAEDKALFFDRIFKRNASLYLLGATTGTGDAYSVLEPLMGRPDGAGGGKLNLGGYGNAQVDALLARIATEPGAEARRRLMADVQRLHQQDVGHIPLYQQWQSWGARRGLRVVQTPEGGMPWKDIVATWPAHDVAPARCMTP